ncbi:hypothetical protein ACE6H2_005131 [Prunus campanulata]
MAESSLKHSSGWDTAKPLCHAYGNRRHKASEQLTHKGENNTPTKGRPKHPQKGRTETPTKKGRRRADKSPQGDPQAAGSRLEKRNQRKGEEERTSFPPQVERRRSLFLTERRVDLDLENYERFVERCEQRQVIQAVVERRKHLEEKQPKKKFVGDSLE